MLTNWLYGQPLKPDPFYPAPYYPYFYFVYRVHLN